MVLGRMFAPGQPDVVGRNCTDIFQAGSLHFGVQGFRAVAIEQSFGNGRDIAGFRGPTGSAFFSAEAGK